MIPIHVPKLIRQAKIQVYEDRSGRWRFNLAIMIDGGVFDIVSQSSDSYPSAGEAEAMARAVLCPSWEVVGEEVPVAQPSPGRLRKIVAEILLWPITIWRKLT